VEPVLRVPNLTTAGGRGGLFELVDAARAGWRAAFVVFASILAGCSGAGLIPFGDGPHSMSPARLDSIVAQASKANHVDPRLVKAVINVESGGDPSAVSSAGAMGLMQLMPGTALTYGVSNPWDPQQNVAGGAKKLSDLLREYNGNIALALAAYNAGSGAVARYKGIPPYAETGAYVSNVLSQYRVAGSRR
jgi:soluble lytic murein transglycosylase-like protein